MQSSSGSEKKIACPKCKTWQPPTDVCINCGVIMAKVKKPAICERCNHKQPAWFDKCQKCGATMSDNKKAINFKNDKSDRDQTKDKKFDSSSIGFAVFLGLPCLIIGRYIFAYAWISFYIFAIFFYISFVVCMFAPVYEVSQVLSQQRKQGKSGVFHSIIFYVSTICYIGCYLWLGNMILTKLGFGMPVISRYQDVTVYCSKKNPKPGDKVKFAFKVSPGTYATKINHIELRYNKDETLPIYNSPGKLSLSKKSSQFYRSRVFRLPSDFVPSKAVFNINIRKSEHVGRKRYRDVSGSYTVPFFNKYAGNQPATAGEKKIPGSPKEIEEKLDLKFVSIEPGTFIMGSPNTEKGRKVIEKLHTVTLTKGFRMHTTEVTINQWKTIMESIPSECRQYPVDYPVTGISWNEANTFINKLNTLLGKNYSLPTEAQWEYACRAGSVTRYHWGNEINCSKSNFGNSAATTECKGKNPGKPIKVASYPPNAWGLFDMHGNVFEMCRDYCNPYRGAWTDTYKNNVIDPVCTKGNYRILRGGSCHTPAAYCRSASRSNCSVKEGYELYGFRLVENIETQ